jgi:hypothetical protein
LGLGCFLGSLVGVEQGLVDKNGLVDQRVKGLVDTEKACELGLDGALQLFLELENLFVIREIPNGCKRLKLSGQGASGALLFEGIEVAANLLHIKRVCIKGVQLGPEEGPGLESGVIGVGTEEGVGPCGWVATQTGDGKVDFVGIVFAERDGFVHEIELAVTDKRGILGRFAVKLGRRIEFKVFGGDLRRRRRRGS